MLQILIFMFAVYLVFKGVEIFQIALTSPLEHPRRQHALAIGLIAIAVAVLAAMFFVTIGVLQSSIILRQLESLPSP